MFAGGCVNVAAGGRVAVFPVSDKAWLDTGEWAEYRKALKQFEVDG